MFPDLPFKTQWHILSTNFSAFTTTTMSPSGSGSSPSIEIFGKSSQSFTTAEAKHLIFTCQKSVLHRKVFLNQWSFQLDHSSGNHTASWAQKSTYLSCHPPGELMILCSIGQQTQSKQSTFTFRAPLSSSPIARIVSRYVKEQHTAQWNTKHHGPPSTAKQGNASLLQWFLPCWCRTSTLKNGQNHSKSLMSSLEWSLPGNMQGCVSLLPWTPKCLPNVDAIDLRML